MDDTNNAPEAEQAENQTEEQAQGAPAQPEAQQPDDTQSTAE